MVKIERGDHYYDRYNVWPEYFKIGEILSQVYKHVGENGQQHKGNFRVIRTLNSSWGDNDDTFARISLAQCIMPGCEQKIIVIIDHPKVTITDQMIAQAIAKLAQ